MGEVYRCVRCGFEATFDTAGIDAVREHSEDTGHMVYGYNEGDGSNRLDDDDLADPYDFDSEEE